jgi:hypothetical protein
MTQEDKDLVLKDICARLPYGVICQMEDKMRFIGEESPYYDYILSERHREFLRRHKGYYIKPYLRPLSSMTEEEMKECEELGIGYNIEDSFGKRFELLQSYHLFDWLNAHHFDYRGLIGKGLAISTEVFNPYKD